MHNYSPETNASPSQSDLNGLISALMKAITPKAMDSRSCFINEIPAKLNLITDIKLVSSVLDGILSFAVKHARQSYIRLSAKVYGHILVVNISKPGLFNSSSVQQDVNQLHAMAEKMLGSVSLSLEPRGVSTLSFGFPNLPSLDQ